MSELVQGRTELSKDARPIAGIFHGPAHRYVGTDGVTKIVAYDEHGQYGWVPWYAVYQGDEIFERIPATEWGVQYKQENPF